MEVEKIESWVGQDVLASDGERIGKLEDVYYASGSDEAVLVSVKTGLLGRKLHVVPLANASLARDHLKIAYTKSQVADGPQVEGGAELGPAEQDEVGRHFGVELSSASKRFESGQARLERQAKIEEMSGRAHELEQMSEEKREQAEASQHTARETAQEADRLEEERREAEESAARLRAGDERSPEGPKG